MSNEQKMKIWQSQLPECIIVISLLLCIEYPLVVCTNATLACSIREPANLQVVAVIPTDSVNKSVDDIQLSNWQKGEEILPGAHLAAKEINDHDLPNLLSGY